MMDRAQRIEILCINSWEVANCYFTNMLIEYLKSPRKKTKCYLRHYWIVCMTFADHISLVVQQKNEYTPMFKQH